MKKVTLIALLSTLLSPIVAANSLSPHDVGITNEERILYWLKKRDQVPSSELDSSFKSYMSNIEVANHSIKNGFRQFKSSSTDFSNTNKQQAAFSTSLVPDQSINDVKVLAILIDFPDLKHDDNQLVDQDTEMFYVEYSTEHYQQMLFNTQGYAGPDGQSLSTAADYYKAASGNSLNFTGQVYGWVSADNNAKVYGERQGTTRDKNAPALVKEAVEKAVAKFNINLADYDLTDLDDIDGDGILNEPNGIIDHVMIFHSSIGEEAGGGYLSTDAIWSHRYYVFDENSGPSEIAGSSIKLFGYTINPIDAGIGVVVHEFGHDLGLLDEYDLQSNTVGEPVASWSVMSTGSWAGSPRGSEPVMFSPYALEYLQNRYQGNWVNQLTLDMDEIDANSQQTLINTASTSQLQNQIKVTLPPRLEKFKTPVEGDFQYYSNTGDNVSNSLVNTIALPSTTEALTLSFIAYYSIERDYDLVQVKVNGEPIASNYTQAVNPYYGNIGPYISGDSFLNSDAKQPNGYLTHKFDLSAYAGQIIDLKIEYITDANTHYYGFVVDDMRIEQSDTLIWHNNAQDQINTEFNGFAKVGSYTYASPSHYYLQLRSYTGVDSSLQAEQYSPGLLLWYSDESQADNNTTEHPGSGFALVVDADQRSINKGSTQTSAASAIQIRDAAFSLYQQRAGLGDDDLSAITEFTDKTDYSFSAQQPSGVMLPQVGFGFNIINQSSDSEDIEVQLNYDVIKGINFTKTGLIVDFNIEGLALTPADKFAWTFDDGSSSTELNPTHTYQNYGTYDVEFTASSGTSQQVTVVEVTLVKPLSVNEIEYEVNQGILIAQASFTGGVAPYTYNWQLGDGSTLTTQSITHNYLYSGDYQVTLTVTDNEGTEQTKAVDVTAVVPLSIDANVTVNDLSAQFNAQVTGGFNSYTYSWDFGDGSAVSNLQNPIHTYQADGAFNVTLSVTDTQTNDTFTKELSLTVQKQQSSSGSSGGSLAGLLVLLLLCLPRIKRS
ncbi:M6 family metalloprotease domain-containing protein [Pseudoalteromonas distincta]|uniref:immune inhibitor A domain-containing protein n=1 Tax=Pseudoalteromonas TaxID=53246 RepID=UPI000420D9EB|nr:MULTISPECIES: immune inhibitor A domain-containing protein [Pseudoalteromonas]TVU78029.1 M6 family metalloprotease domain-containing protein [Pseudoalteromonas elyakovii]